MNDKNRWISIYDEIGLDYEERYRDMGFLKDLLYACNNYCFKCKTFCYSDRCGFYDFTSTCFDIYSSTKSVILSQQDVISKMQVILEQAKKEISVYDRRKRNRDFEKNCFDLYDSLTHIIGKKLSDKDVIEQIGQVLEQTAKEIELLGA